MTLRRSSGLAALLVPAGLALSGCAAGPAQGQGPAIENPATLQEAGDGGPGVITLSEAALDRLAIETAPVADSGGVLTLPYAAVVYEPDGSSWAYVETAPRTYQRQAIEIDAISGDEVTLTSGPPADTQVVVQGAAELVGVETGIDGEE
jgi:hypothetical protein